MTDTSLVSQNGIRSKPTIRPPGKDEDMPQDSTGQSAHNIHWRRNLFVCVAGSFSTLVAMTLLLPFLPLYVEQLGAEGDAAIVQWSGIAYGATVFAAALGAPLWGR